MKITLALAFLKQMLRILLNVWREQRAFNTPCSGTCPGLRSGETPLSCSLSIKSGSEGVPSPGPGEGQGEVDTRPSTAFYPLSLSPKGARERSEYPLKISKRGRFSKLAASTKKSPLESSTEHSEAGWVPWQVIWHRGRAALLLLLIALSGTSALAQERDTLEIALPEIEIQATRAAETEATAPFAVSLRRRSRAG